MRDLIARIREVNDADANWRDVYGPDFDAMAETAIELDGGTWSVVYGPFSGGRYVTGSELDDASNRVRAARVALPRPIRWIWR